MSLERYHNDVLRFHSALDLHVGNVRAPGFLNANEARLRARLINEEVGETVKGIDSIDQIETIDGLCDSLYVALGTAISIGVDLTTVVRYYEKAWPPPPPFDSYSAAGIFWNATEFRNLLLAASRVTCRAIEDLDALGTSVALIGLIGAIMSTAFAWNIPLLPFWEEVQRSNMAKEGGPIREDGKRLKPPGWTPPALLPIYSRVFGLSQGI